MSRHQNVCLEQRKPPKFTSGMLEVEIMSRLT